MWLWVVLLLKRTPLVDSSIWTWSIPSLELFMTWFLKLLAQAPTLQIHQQKYILMGLLVQSSPHPQQNLPSKTKLPPLILRLLRFSPRSILFRVLKPWATIKSRAPLESISNLGIWINLVPRTTFQLHTSIKLSITVLGVSYSHLRMVFLATIRLRYFSPITIRQHLYARGEPLPTRSYPLALRMLGPHSSMPCPMHFTTLRILWSLSLMISLCTHSYGKTILGILETFS